jgi:glycosidase
MRGTPFIFQGDEIGMTNTKLKEVADSKDIETQNGWREAQKRGMSEDQFLSLANYSGRDNARTPMQWDDSVFGGFTNGHPWMDLNPNKSRINVATQTTDSHSILSYFRSMTSLRKAHPVLTYGTYEPIETKDDRVFAYYRQEGKEKYQIVLHFSNQNSTFPIPQNGQRLIGNYADVSSSLRPWEAMIYKL